MNDIRKERQMKGKRKKDKRKRRKKGKKERKFREKEKYYIGIIRSCNGIFKSNCFKLLSAQMSLINKLKTNEKKIAIKFLTQNMDSLFSCSLSLYEVTLL